MYFWNAARLSQELRAETVHTLDKVIYFALLLAQLILRITPYNLIPLLYHTLFHYAQQKLAQEIPVPALSLKVFHVIDYQMPIVLLVISFLMLIWLSITCKDNDAGHFIERIVCLNGPISIRIMCITSCIFLAAASAAGFYFISQLTALAQQTSLNEGLLDYAYKLLNKANFVSKLWQGMKTLKQAELILHQMNLASWYFYWAAQIIAILSTIWYFLTMKKYLTLSRP